MRKFMMLLLVAASLVVGTTTLSSAQILFDYEVQVDGQGPLIPVSYSQSSGDDGTLEVTGLAGVGFDADGLGTDIDVAEVVASQTTPNAAFSNFDGSTSSYTFTIKIIDLDSGLSGTFTVQGFLHGRFKELPGAQYALGNTYTLPPSGSMVIGTNRYFLDFPAFGQDFDTPSPDGSWTFNIRAEPLPRCDIECPPNVTVECPGSTDPAATGEATTSDPDNCEITYKDSVEEGDCAPPLHIKQVITRTWTATHTESGLTTTCVQIITVVDTTPPVLQNVPEGGDLGCNPIPPTCDEGVTATDACDGELPVTCTPGPVIEDGCSRSQTFTYSAEDSCGNQASQSVTYTWVVDTVPPDITCPNNITVSPTSTNPCSAVVIFNVSATDNCGIPTVTCVATFPDGTTAPVESGATFPEGTTIVVCTATDACGNETSCTFTITVERCQKIQPCTFTQGGWGAPPRGNNPGMLLKNNFTAISGGDNSITIGLPGRSITFTSAAAIDKFLPQGGTPRALPAGNLVNPSATPSQYGVLAGQVLALTLNIGASDAGILPAGLGSLVLCNTGTPLDGLTVNQILALGNTALGGGALPAGVTLSGLNDIITRINEGFNDCVPSGWASGHLCQPLS